MYSTSRSLQLAMDASSGLIVVLPAVSMRASWRRMLPGEAAMACEANCFSQRFSSGALIRLSEV